MRVGLCTTDFLRPLPAAELFERAASLGFETVQLALGSVQECGFTPSAHVEIPESIPDGAISAIREASRRTGIPIGAMNGTWNMAHPAPALRADAVRRMEIFFATANELDCPIVTLCSGTRSPVHLWHPHEDNATPEAWNDMLGSMRAAARLAEQYGVTLAIETEAANIIDTPEKARRVMDETGSDALKMILDCANLFHAGDAHPGNVRPTIDRAMEFFGKDVVLAHGKDIRESDGIHFCGTGFGIVDFPYMIESLKKAGFTGDMMLHGAVDEDEIPVCLSNMRTFL